MQQLEHRIRLYHDQTFYSAFRSSRNLPVPTNQLSPTREDVSNLRQNQQHPPRSNGKEKRAVYIRSKLTSVSCRFRKHTEPLSLALKQPDAVSSGGKHGGFFSRSLVQQRTAKRKNSLARKIPCYRRPPPPPVS